MKNVTAEQAAQKFHETYERLAPSFGYRTRDASAKPWASIPEDNRGLMVAVVREVLDWLRGDEPASNEKGERETCGNCAWFDRLSERDGYCRAMPPVLLNKGAYGVFPVVLAKEWCRQFERRGK